MLAHCEYIMLLPQIATDSFQLLRCKVEREQRAFFLGALGGHEDHAATAVAAGEEKNSIIDAAVLDKTPRQRSAATGASFAAEASPEEHVIWAITLRR